MISLYYKVAGWLITCISLITVIMLAALHLNSSPLPQLLYSRGETLFVRSVGCPDIVSTCVSRQRQLLSGMHTFAVADWSPDGQYIAALKSEGWTIYPTDCLLDNQTSCDGVLLNPPSLDVRIAWGPDGSTLAYVTGDGTTLQIKTRGCWDGSPARECLDLRVDLDTGGLLVEPVWSGNGQYMAFVSSAWNLYLLNTACLTQPETCGQQIQLISRDPEQENWPTLSQDGSRLLYLSSVSSIHQEIFILDIASGQRRQLTEGGMQSATPDWTADERYVAYTRLNDREVTTYLLDIYVLDLERGISTPLVNNPGRDMYPNWGPGS
jgi:Tol biopolymer transport system component